LVKENNKKGFYMRIENEMLKRFGTLEAETTMFNERTLSGELDFFFDNVLDTVVDYFTEKEMVKL
jgi:hypothetical protein